MTYTRRPVEQGIVTDTLCELIPGAAPANLTVEVTDTDGTTRNTWTGTPAGLADRICTRLYGRGSRPAASSPLQQADDAKRRRDIGALTGGYVELSRAPWYPARPGDVLHVHYEAGGPAPAAGETYVIEADEPEGLLRLRLVAHTLPTDEEAGWFAADGDVDPVCTPWFEAGPERLTIVRDGRVVHAGGAR